MADTEARQTQHKPSLLDEAKAANAALRKQLHEQEEATAQSRRSSSTSSKGLYAYTTLPVSDKLYNLPSHYEGWDYKTRACASAPIDDAVAHRLSGSTEGGVVYTRTSPRKKGAANAKSPSRSPARSPTRSPTKKKAEGAEGADEEDKDEPAPAKSEADKSSDLSVADKCDLWFMENSKSILANCALADSRCKGLLANAKLVEVLEASGCPASDDLGAIVGDAAEVDYAAFCNAHKASGTRINNKLRASRPGAAQVMPAVVKPKTKRPPEIPFSEVKAVREEMDAAKQEARKKKEQEAYEYTKRSLELSAKTIKNERTKESFSNALLSYSPAKSSTKRAINETKKASKTSSPANSKK